MSPRNIWVVVERREGKIHPVSFELLAKGKDLKAELGEELVAVFFGGADPHEREACGRFSADELLCLDVDPSFTESFEIQADILGRAARERRPSIILAGATVLGRSLMPLVAVRLGTGLTADCTELAVDPEKKLLLQTRPAFGGNILATIVCPESKPQMATVRPHVFGPDRAKVEKSRSGNALERDPLPRLAAARYAPGELRFAEVLQTIVESGGSDITESDVIVAGGRGLGKPEGFGLLERLAARLGGMLGASRGAVDLGWIGSAFQVGQTGHTVNPKVYIACGISGAIQHVAGMKGAELIVAVNEDPEAPIFQVADVGIVGDLYDVVPRVLEELSRGEEAPR